MQTPDGYWRVEVVRYGPREQRYRVWHATTCVARHASISTVQRILGDAYAALAPADVELPTASPRRAPTQ